MKISLSLLALIAATSGVAAIALAQNPVAPAVVTAPAIEKIAPASWEFTPDFGRAQSRVSWRIAPRFEDELLVSTTNNADMTVSETINFPDKEGNTLAVLKATFDKRGKLQKQDLYDKQGKLLQTQTNFDVNMPLSVPGSIVYLQTIVHPQDLQRRFAISLYNLPIVLSASYDARGRRIYDSFQPKLEPSRSAAYTYNAQGLKSIELTGNSAATITQIERDADGRMRALTGIQNGLLTRSARPIKDDKNVIIGTRIEDYASGILQEVNEITHEDGKDNRTSESYSTTTTNENGQQTTENKFELRMNVGPRAPAVATVEVRERTLYKNAKIATEELFRDGVLTQRSEFNDNGVIAKTTDFNADGSIASEIDSSVIPSANGGIIGK